MAQYQSESRQTRNLSGPFIPDQVYKSRTEMSPVEEQTVIAVAAITRDGEFFGYRTVRIPTFNYVPDDDIWNELEEFLKAWDTLYASISGFLSNFKRI